ncbi:unnamed protein product, partial [Adineta ricciae]
MFTKTLAIIDCISTLILIRPEYYDRFNDILLRIVYLLPGLCKMNVIPSHVLIEAFKTMKHVQSLTILFLDSDLFPSFVDKTAIVPSELDPSARLPELDSAYWGRLEILCSENQYADEWIPVFLALLDVTRETIHVCETTERFRAILFHILFSTLSKSIKIKRWLPIREQCLKIIWKVIIRCLASTIKPSNDNESNRSPIFIFGWLQHPSVSQALIQCAMPSDNDTSLSDPTNRASYQSCLQNAMSIISSLIDYQVENFNHNLHSTTNPFASKVLIKVCIDFLLQHINDVKAPICLRCLTSLAKITPGLSILLETNIERFRTFIIQNIKDRKSPDLTMAILDFLIVCVNSQPALLGYLCDLNTSATATFGNSTILQPIVELLRWSAQNTSEVAATDLFILTVTFITQFWEQHTQLLVDYFVKINDFWKNISAPITNTSVSIKLMDTGDKRAVSTSFRLLTQHLLNYTTDQTGNDFYDILNQLITNNCLLHWIKACRTFFQSNIEDEVLNEQSLSFAFFSSIIYFTKALLCLNNDRIRKILPGGETWLEELASIVQLVLTRNDSTCMKIAVMCLNLTINANIKWKNEKAQPPLTILPTYIKLATCILAPEYVSIYVKYCYLDALVLLIQIFLEHTPDIDQQQDDLTRYSTVLSHLLDFVDYCNDIIDVHPSTTPQYKCAVKALVHTFHLLSIFTSREESKTLSVNIKQERTVSNVIDLFHKVSQERDNFRVCYTIVSFLYDLTKKDDSVEWFHTMNIIPRTLHTFRFIIQQQISSANEDPTSQTNWSKVIRLYLLLNIRLIHEESVHGDNRHFNNASDVFAACSEYIVESFHNVTREFSLPSLDNADVCCQFFACLTQFYNQLMSKHHKEASICIAAVNYLLHDSINLLLHSALVHNMLTKKVRCAYRSELENQENIVPDYSLSQSTIIDHSHLSQRSLLRPSSALFNQSTSSSPASVLPVTPGEGTPKPRLVNVRQQVAAASAQPASSQTPEFEQIQVGLLRLLCTCCWALRPCTIPLNDLNESLLYKQTIDYDSFKYLVEPLFNTPTLERRTAPSFGTWLTGAQYIVTQMERFSLIKSNSPRPARIKESDLERLVQHRPFLVLALEHLLSLILSQVPLFMRSTLLTETQKNMMKQTLSLELDYIFSNLNLTERTSSASGGGSDPNSQRTSVNVPTPATVGGPGSHKSLVMSVSNMSHPTGSVTREAYTPFSVGTNVTCSGASEYNNSTYLKDVCTSIWKLYKRIIQVDPVVFMSGPLSAFARYSQEAPPSPPQTNSVLPASRKRKRVSAIDTNGHSKDKQPNKNRSTSLLPTMPTSHANGKSHLSVEHPNTMKKSRNIEKKFLSPAYPTPHPQRRVILTESSQTRKNKAALQEANEMEEEEEEDDDDDDDDNDDDENEDDLPFSAWLRDHVPIDDSTLLGQHLFGLIIDPIPVKQFMKRTWQKEPLLISRKQPNYYSGLFSTSDIDDILRENTLEYGENIDLTFYNPATAKKERHNPEGRARPAVVWDSYNEGCSVRILNPHTYSVSVWKLLSCLQEYFGSLVGANTYLTPPGSQGFAPHYDDIDAFILQLEGKKHWRVYKPLNDDEVLPLKSSGDLDKNILNGIKPCIDVVLEAGDLLYMPRGYIHQGNTLDDAHSLHLTVSCYQQHTWGDLFKILLPKA